MAKSVTRPSHKPGMYFPNRPRELDLQDIEDLMLQLRGKLAMLAAFAHGQSLPDSDPASNEEWWGLQLALDEIKEALEFKFDPALTKEVKDARESRSRRAILTGMRLDANQAVESDPR